ncbi:hypothetical protein CGRA01v4_15012 [Colletotrichum graminicola]|nr:hypothetical protein CGRA01v4_15012 [Colletotrichum graminicola]
MGPTPINEESAEGLKLGLEGLFKSASGLQTLWRMPQPDAVARAERVRSQYRRSVVWLLVLRRAVQNFRQAVGKNTERYGS